MILNLEEEKVKEVRACTKDAKTTVINQKRLEKRMILNEALHKKQTNLAIL